MTGENESAKFWTGFLAGAVLATAITLEAEHDWSIIDLLHFMKIAIIRVGGLALGITVIILTLCLVSVAGFALNAFWKWALRLFRVS